MTASQHHLIQILLCDLLHYSMLGLNLFVSIHQPLSTIITVLVLCINVKTCSSGILMSKFETREKNGIHRMNNDIKKFQCNCIVVETGKAESPTKDANSVLL